MPISSHEDNAIKEMYENILKIIEMSNDIGRRQFN